MHRLLTFALLVLMLPARAQKAPAIPPPLAPAFASPEGVYVVVGTVARTPERPGPKGLTGFRVLRADGEGRKFREVADIRPAATLAAFRALAGEDVLTQLKAQEKLADDAAAWRFIQQHPALDDYGLLGLHLGFRRALGTAWLDTEVASAPAGSRYTYRLLALGPNGKPGRDEEGPAPERTVVLGQPSPQPRPRLRRAEGLDSLVRLRWTARSRPAQGYEQVGQQTLFGRVYRQRAGEKAFTVAAPQIMATRHGDSLRFEWEERARPESLYRYYVVPLDFVGNPGPASDTAYVLTVDPSRVALLQNATARDTTQGIVLRWPALPAKPYYIGIEVQRSRDGRGSYVRLDTIPATATSYLDTRLLPNISYHYRLRALLGNGVAAGPDLASSTPFATHQGGRGPAPLPPARLTAEPEGTGIRLRWQPADGSAELDLDGYFVCRGNSLQDSLQVVSAPLRGLRPGQLAFLDTTARNPRREYVYAVLAVSRSGQRSAYSNKASARPRRPVAVASPLGLRGYPDAGALHLDWDDAARRDAAVVGYRVYRRSLPAGAGSPKAAPAFELLSKSRLTAPAYDDATARPGLRYEYAATSVDALGNESPLSPAAVLALPAAALPVPAELSVRPLGAALEISWGGVSTPVPTGYALYRRAAEQAEPQRLATVPAGQLRYRDQSAKPGVLYLYSISAVGAGQESARTPEAGARRW